MNWKLLKEWIKISKEWDEFHNSECVSITISNGKCWVNLIIIKLWTFINEKWKLQEYNINCFDNKEEILKYFLKELEKNIN